MTKKQTKNFVKKRKEGDNRSGEEIAVEEEVSYLLLCMCVCALTGTMASI